MYLNDLVNQGPIPVLEKLMAFSEVRHSVLAENIANIDTPGYITKQLDPAAFEQALRRAVEQRGDDPNAPLVLPPSDEFSEDDQGHLKVTPSTQPAENILFHDRTNASIEKLMADLNENTLVYSMASEMLRVQFDSLKTAIRGRI